jgi:hypothetical protein
MFSDSVEPKILTESEIMELKKKHGIILFYMNGCGHCEIMKPAWNKLITELKDKHKNEIILGAVESGSMDIFNNHGIKPSVSGFPTILYFHPNTLGNPEPYKGDRSYEHLKQWIFKKKGSVKGRNNNNPIVILTDYNTNKKNNIAEMRKNMGIGMDNKKGLAFSQSGGGNRGSRRRTRRRIRYRRHYKTSMSKHKNTRRRSRR